MADVDFGFQVPLEGGGSVPADRVRSFGNSAYGTAAAPVTYLNRGWCTDHSTVEVWESTGSPSAVHPGHNILAGSVSFSEL